MSDTPPNTSESKSETIGGVPVEKMPPKAPEKLLVGNKEFDVSSIAALQKQAEEQASIIKALYSKNPADDNTMLGAYEKALLLAGYTAEEAKAEVAALNPKQEEKKPVDGGAPRKQEPSETDHLTASILRREIETTVKNAVAEDKTVKELLAAVSKTQTKEVAAKLQASITAEVDAIFRSHLGSLRQQQGGIKDIEVISKEMPNVLSKVVERYALLAPTIKMAGRAGPAPVDPFSALRSAPPVEVPELNKIPSQIDKMQAIRNLVSDRLHRVAMQDAERTALTN